MTVQFGFPTNAFREYSLEEAIDSIAEADYDGFLGALEDRGYDGFVTDELYPDEGTAVETARGAMTYLEEHGWT